MSSFLKKIYHSYYLKNGSNNNDVKEKTMKKIVCELCGESDFVKVNDYFECQVCGAKYAVAEAKKLFQDVGDTPKPETPPVEEPKVETTPKPKQAPKLTPVEEEEVAEDPVLAPRPVPTTVKKVVVTKKAPTNDSTAVKRIVSSVQKTTQAREEEKPKTTVKKVVVKPVVVEKPKPAPTVSKKTTAAAAKSASKGTNLGVEAKQMIQNFFILAQTAYDSQNYTDAESYANRIIELDPKNCDAWLMKGNCAGWQTFSPNFRLLESINCWNTCLVNSVADEHEDYLFTVRTNCIEIAVAYVMRNITDFKKTPSNEAITKIKETIDFIEPMMRKANQTFGVDIIVYEDKLASNISAMVTEVSKQATATFGKRKETQTDEALAKFIETQDYCIETWEYLMDLAKRHGTVTAILHNIVKMHETIIRSTSYKQSGNKFKVSRTVTLSEKNLRLEKIQKAKKKLEDKFVDIRKRDRVDQKIKNAKYWEEHKEEKEQLETERLQLEHEIFELENSKLKMPILNELKKLEQEAIRLQVLKDNPTYSNKERAAFMEELTKTRKLVVTKKREIAGIINPIEDRIEKLKKKKFTIETELNMNR